MRFAILLLAISTFIVLTNSAYAQPCKPVLEYTISMPDPSAHCFQVELNCSGWNTDTVYFKMPVWMPGYYQLMNYAGEVKDISVTGFDGKSVPLKQMNTNTWQHAGTKGKPFRVKYNVKADREFVANNYFDSTHAYIVPAATFLYIEGHINTPVKVTVIPFKNWEKTATGLEPVPGKSNQFEAPDFDILYDCPILCGNLEEFPSFFINGTEHRFIAYHPGDFDRQAFMNNLKKVVEAGTAIIGDIPYRQYTFIGIGKGRGGIEHLNNTTVSFDGSGLDTKEGMNRTMNFLAHEYFHHYNVKRIRPLELGPFDYDRENRTNLLWVSEGLTVYYEYMMVKRAGLINEHEFFTDFENNINTTQEDPGRLYQSLAQASYNTWSDGPFGNPGKDIDKSISYYEKGPVAALILDLAIRNSTRNTKSLDDVMRYLYWQYYKRLQRGFTDAEFQQACETIAGISMAEEFEYIYTTKEIDYNKYLAFAGLTILVAKNQDSWANKLVISRLDHISPLQNTILESWLGK